MPSYQPLSEHLDVVDKGHKQCLVFSNEAKCCVASVADNASKAVSACPYTGTTPVVMVNTEPAFTESADRTLPALLGDQLVIFLNRQVVQLQSPPKTLPGLTRPTVAALWGTELSCELDGVARSTPLLSLRQFARWVGMWLDRPALSLAPRDQTVVCDIGATPFAVTPQVALVRLQAKGAGWLVLTATPACLSVILNKLHCLNIVSTSLDKAQ